MTDILWDTVSGWAAAERRVKPRIRSTRLILVKLADENGGVASNITEDGLCLAVAVPLSAGQLTSSIQIRLAGSKGWIAASGQIVWTSESRRRAGVQFTNLGTNERQQIRSWIASETSSSHHSAQGSEAPLQSGGSETLGPTGNAGVAKIRAQLPELVAKLSEQETAIAVTSTTGRQDTQQEAGTRFDRRLYPRRKILSLASVEWDGARAGVALDLGEGGLALVSPLPFAGDESLTLRIQLPDTKDRIEASAQIAWKAKSGRRAGVKFVRLTDDARRRIKDWVLKEAIPDQAAAPRAGLGQTATAVEPRDGGQVVSSAGKFSRAVSQELQSRVAGSSLPFEETAWPARKPSLGVESSYPTDIHKDRSLVDDRSETRSGRKTRKRVTLVLLIAVASFGIGWVTASLPARNAIARFATDRKISRESNSATVSDAAHDAVATPDREQKPVDQLPFARSPVDVGSQARTDEKHQATSEASSTKSTGRQLQTDTAPVSSPPREERYSSKSEVPHQGVPTNATPTNTDLAAPSATSVAQQQVPSAAPTVDPPADSLSSQQPGSALASAPPSLSHKDETGSQSQPRQDARANLSGSVAIVADRYPSIRLPLESRSKKSTAGELLQLGHLISRVEPVYPMDAKRDGIEGAVDMHALIGRDGSIEDLVSVNGPPLLIPAAVNAVRQWKYSQTLVAGQPVETEENISVKFQLSNPE